MNGNLVESLIMAKLEQKCDVTSDPVYDHVYKIDFLIQKFKNIDRIVALGVQVTTRMHDTYKMKVFLAERQKKTLVDRSIYIEVHPEVNVAAWGSELICNALIAFAFQKGIDQDILGVRINPDISYEFFDLSETVENTPTESLRTLSGKITRYYPTSSSGTITTNIGEWFFHLNDVTDERLRTSFIPNIRLGDENRVVRPIYVEFDDGGYQRENVKFPKALNVKLSQSKI